jgi:hypothetical protein
MSVRFKDRVGRDITCLLLQVYYLYVYIYSPESLNNTSIIFRHISLPLSFYILLEIILFSQVLSPTCPARLELVSSLLIHVLVEYST